MHKELFSDHLKNAIDKRSKIDHIPPFEEERAWRGWILGERKF
jgi:hypothetical protein